MTLNTQQNETRRLEEDLRRLAADAARGEQGPGLPRLGVLLRAGTFAVDGAAVAAAIVFLGAGTLLLTPVLAAAWLLLLRSWGAYRRGIAYPLGDELKTISLGGLSGGLLLFQVGPSIGLHPVQTGVGALAATVAFLLFGRLTLRATSAILRRHRALVRRALLVGDGPDAHELLANLEAWPGLGVQVVGVCADTSSSSVRGLPVLGFSRSCNLVARDLGVRTVILAPGGLSPDDCHKIHADLLDSEIEVVLAPNVAHIEAGRLSTRQVGGLPLLRLEQRGDWLRLAVKRAFDLATSFTLLVLLTPILVGIALLVRLDSPGPAFFRQRRVGKDGVEFELWKFRTMREDAERLLPALRAANGTGDRGALFKLRHDPRVTRLGRWLRRTSVDELPQLWNVLLGEMSLVGPRPALPEEVAEFDTFTLLRLRVKPGITGLWQVSGRSDASFATYSRMDAFYAENWTLLGDLRIVLKTIPVVLRWRGAY